jgi:hypothetical protein
MKTVRLPFVWNVLLHDWNAHDVRVYNVLSTRREDYIKKLKKKCATKEEFIELLDRDLMHQFWSRSEYEMILYIEDGRVYLEPWCGTFKEGRIDITDGNTLDWPAFARKMLSKHGWHDANNNRTYVKFDAYDQLKFRFDELMDFVWNYKHKYQRVKKEENK